MQRKKPAQEVLADPATAIGPAAANVQLPESTHSGLRFVAAAAGISLLFFGLFRVPWIQNQLLIPYAQAQQVVAGWLIGLEDLPVVVDFSCTGADVISLCLGAILAFPKPWKSRLKGAIWGLLLITLINTVRIGSLSLAVDRRQLFETLHYVVWPAILIIIVATYVFSWMHMTGRNDKGDQDLPVGQGSKVQTSARRNWQQVVTSLPGRFALWTIPLVGLFIITSKWYLESSWLLAVGRWAAVVGGSMMSAVGATATTSGNILTTSNGSFQVTPACMATPLIPVYYAAIFAFPFTASRRSILALVGPLLFFSLGTLRLLVLALPAAIVGSHSIAIHAFNQLILGALIVGLAIWWQHRQQGATLTFPVRRLWFALGLGLGVGWLIGQPYTTLVEIGTAQLQSLFSHSNHDFLNPQGAATMLPAFHLGFLVALAIAVSGHRRWSRRPALVGVIVLMLSHLALFVGLGELWSHVELSPHVRELRAWAIAAPVLIALWLHRHQYKTNQVPTIGLPTLPRPALNN